MKFPKIRYGPEIRLVAGCQDSESHVFHQTFLNPARGKHSPSSQPPLLGASPLRTGLETFASSGSSIR
jgi:hypothetical protein